jgi:hypothetical protein
MLGACDVSPGRESEVLRTGIEEFDLEHLIGDGAALSDKLIATLPVYNAKLVDARSRRSSGEWTLLSEEACDEPRRRPP